MNSVGCFSGHGSLISSQYVVFKIVVNIINVNKLVICTSGLYGSAFHASC